MRSIPLRLTWENGRQSPLQSFGLLFFSSVFFACGSAAAQMALLLVCLQDLADTVEQTLVDETQLKGHVFMYRAFADSEVFRRFTHCGIMLHDIIPKQLTALWLTQI